MVNTTLEVVNLTVVAEEAMTISKVAAAEEVAVGRPIMLETPARSLSMHRHPLLEGQTILQTFLTNGTDRNRWAEGIRWH